MLLLDAGICLKRVKLLNTVNCGIGKIEYGKTEYLDVLNPLNSSQCATVQGGDGE